MRKFTENINPSELSEERVESLKRELEEVMTNTINNLTSVKNIQSELDTYRSNKDINKNDQLDDSYVKMSEIIKEYEDSVSKLEDVMSKLDDYNNNGRQFLY